MHCGQDADDRSDYEDDSEADDILDEDLFDDVTKLSDDEYFTDSDDEGCAEITADQRTGGGSIPDSGYSSDGDSIAVTEDRMEVEEVSEPVRQSVSVAALPEFNEEMRKCKALCYEDVCLFIVQNPKRGERDLLAMEVFLRHHKGADKKPKPYVGLPFADHRPD